MRLFNQMALKRPTSSEDSFLKWTEFLAEFKELPNLTPYGTQLNFIQYHNVDVFALIACIFSLFLYILYLLLKLVVRVFYKITGLFVATKVKVQ